MANIDLTRINTNLAAMNTLNTLRDVNKNLALHQTRLASGKRINEAADDPAGLTLATKFQVRAQSQQQAIDNIGDAKSMLSVAEGGLKKVNEILGKMRIKAEQAASDTLGDAERTAINGDLEQYAQEINDIVENTSWNKQKLLDGAADFSFQTSADSDDVKVTSWKLSQSHTVSGTGSLSLATYAAASTASTAGAISGATVSGIGTVAVNTTAKLSELTTGSYTVRVTIGSTDSVAELFDADGKALSVDSDGAAGGAEKDTKVTFTYDATNGNTLNFGNGLSVDLASDLGDNAPFEFTVNYTKGGTYDVNINSDAAGRDYMNKVDGAIDKVSSSLANIGALMDRLTFKEDSLAIGKVNTEAAFNRIMNADMAQEQLEAVKFGILQQTATTMLAQTNTAPQAILQLFR